MSHLRLQVEIYGTFRFLTCVYDTNLEIQSLYELLENELYSNYAVLFKILTIKDSNHCVLPVNYKIKDCLKNMDQIYAFVRFRSAQETQMQQPVIEQQQQQMSSPVQYHSPMQQQSPIQQSPLPSSPIQSPIQQQPQSPIQQQVEIQQQLPSPPPQIPVKSHTNLYAQILQRRLSNSEMPLISASMQQMPPYSPTTVLL